MADLVTINTTDGPMAPSPSHDDAAVRFILVISSIV